MSISTQLKRIKDAKQAIKDVINSKAGSTVIDKSQLISEYAAAINNLALSGNSEFGYIDEQGNFQPLDLSGDTPADTGEAKAVSLKMFNTGVEAPQAPSTSSMDFYKCAAVHEAQAGGVCYIISGCPTSEVNGTYLPTEYTTEDWEGSTQPVYSNGTYYYYYNPSDLMWCIGVDYNNVGVWMYYIENDSCYIPDGDIVSGMNCTESTVATSSATWDGYKAVLSNGSYSFEETLTTGLTYSVVTPTVDGIYSADALVEVKTLYEGI